LTSRGVLHEPLPRSNLQAVLSVGMDERKSWKWDRNGRKAQMVVVGGGVAGLEIATRLAG